MLRCRHTPDAMPLFRRHAPLFAAAAVVRRLRDDIASAPDADDAMLLFSHCCAAADAMIFADALCYALMLPRCRHADAYAASPASICRHYAADDVYAATVDIANRLTI